MNILVGGDHCIGISALRIGTVPHPKKHGVINYFGFPLKPIIHGIQSERKGDSSPSVP